MSDDRIRARLAELGPDVVHGPRPPRPEPVHRDAPRPHLTRIATLLLVVVVVVVVVPGLVVLGGWWANSVISGPPTGTAEPAGGCDERAVGDVPSGVTVLWRERSGSCPQRVDWYPERGELRTTDGSGATYRIGQPGDVVVLGDWNCDGDTTPGLYEVGTGLVHYYGGWPETGATSRPTSEDLGVIGGEVRVVADGACDEITVEPAMP